MSFEIVGDPAVRRAPASGRRQPHREPRLLRDASICRSSPGAASPIATPATARRCAWSTRRSSAATCAADAARRCGSRCGRRRRRARTPPSCEIVGVVRQVRGRPDEREAFVQVYRPIGAARRPTTSTWWCAPPSGDAARADVGGAGGDRPRRSRSAGRRARHPDARGRRLDGDRAPPVPRRARRHLRRPGADAGDGRRLRRSSATPCSSALRDFAVRRALGATTGDVVRLVVGGDRAGVRRAASPSACCSPRRSAGWSARCWWTSIRSIR